MSHLLRTPCRCGGEEGRIETRNGQDCVFCLKCGCHCYNAPKTETGRAVRSVSTARKDIKPAQRARILMRASGHCELCGKTEGIMHVGHLLSVKDAMSGGLTETEIGDDENLAAFCEECNLGIGEQTVPLRLVIGIQLARIRNRTARKDTA